jgi:hypothetical protein
VYKRANGTNTLDFLARLVEEMPFPIQRIQSDRGGEFFAETVQIWLADNLIKFRPNPPRSPHLNGKVERSQSTDLQEFWARQDPRAADIGQQIQTWQFDCNWRRPHGSLGGKRPVDSLSEVSADTPMNEVVASAYDRTRERLKYRNFKVDRVLAAHWNARHILKGASAASAADRAAPEDVKGLSKRQLQSHI